MFTLRPKRRFSDNNGFSAEKLHDFKFFAIGILSNEKHLFVCFSAKNSEKLENNPDLKSVFWNKAKIYYKNPSCHWYLTFRLSVFFYVYTCSMLVANRSISFFEDNKTKRNTNKHVTSVCEMKSCFSSVNNCFLKRGFWAEKRLFGLCVNIVLCIFLGVAKRL